MTNEGVSTGSAAFVVDRRQTIRSWNPALADATGLAERDAIGRRCNEVMDAIANGGTPSCSHTCSVLRASVAGWATPPLRLTLQRGTERRAASLHTLTMPGSGGSILHVVHVGEAEAPADAGVARATLTRRQQEVLALLADGVAVRTIGERLVLAESTVRNHVRAILQALGAHSMLQAVSEARRRRLI